MSYVNSETAFVLTLIIFGVSLVDGCYCQKSEYEDLNQRYILFINSAQNSEDGKLGLEGETLNIAMADLVKRLNAKAKQLKLLEDQAAAVSVRDDAPPHTGSVPLITDRSIARHIVRRSPVREAEAAAKALANREWESPVL